MSLYDTAELLDTIKHRGSIPVNAGSWDDTSILKAASEEMRTWHLPMLINAKGEYLVKETLIPCVNAQREYLVPNRAAAVRLVSFQGLDRVERPLDDLTPRAQSELYSDRGRLGMPMWYSFREQYIQLFPLPMNATDNLKVLWHIRPSRLILTTNAWQITSKAAATPIASQTTLSFGVVAPTAMAGPSGTLYDFVGVRHPFSIKGYDVVSQFLVTGASSTTMIFTTADLPTDLNVGDWVAAAGYSPLPNIPEELHTPLALRTAASIVQSRQSALAMSLNQEAAATERNLLSGILAPRSKGNPRKLVQRRWMRR